MSNLNYLVFTRIKDLFPKVKNNNIFAISDDVFDDCDFYQKTFKKVKVLNPRWSDPNKILKDSKYLYQLNKKIIKNL